MGEETVLELNTSHADIEFETWDKNQVEIVATVTLEGASDEEVDAYFESDPFRIVGNSSQIEVATSGRRSWNLGLGDTDFDFNVDVEPFFLDLEIPDLPELAVIPEMPLLPPMPPMPYTGFDYGRYKEEGEDYMKEWKKEFEKGFDKEYKKRMEEWGKRVEERAKAWEERNAERLEERERRIEERAAAMEKRMEEVERKRAEALEKREEAMERMAEERDRRIREERRIFISRDDDDSPNIFFYSSDGDNKKYKVKKSIKIKMPKSVRLKMNVKHGEVKLAATTRDINASLRYASLLASTIEGDNTLIKASYSPVVVHNWNYGQLKTDYSERVNLKEVGELRLNAVSSNIIIDKLNDKAFITNNLGKLSINSIHPGFSDVEVSVQNGEVVCKVPNSPVSFYLNGLKSTMNYPDDVQMDKVKNWDNIILKGFKVKDNSGKQISINSKYSHVLLENR